MMSNDQTNPPVDNDIEPTPDDPSIIDADALDDIRPEAQPEPEDPITVLQRDLDELNDKYKRAMADYQNYARRAQLEMANARQQQLRDVARDLLTVLDHFDRAMQVDPKTATVQGLFDGVGIVQNELAQVLQRFGVLRIVVEVGDEFDPNLHEAMMRQAVEGLESNRIAEELQPGYRIGDVALRPVKVAVTE